MCQSFIRRLLKQAGEKGSRCVVGLDPRPELIPTGLVPEARRKSFPTERSTAYAVTEFCRRVIDIVAPYAVAVKPQIAFFERLGLAGLESYSKVLKCARDRGLLVIGDIKRGDIGSTADAYARGHLGHASGSEPVFEVDAATINPYFGSDGVKPFLDAAARNGKGLFVLVKTSNPSGAEIQDLVADGRPVYEHVAGLVHKWAETLKGEDRWSPVGAVVGATWPETAARLRKLMPDSFLLIPGYGAQGGTAESLSPFFAEKGEGAVVNASRSIIYAWRYPPLNDSFTEARWQDAVLAAVKLMRDGIEGVAFGR